MAITAAAVLSDSTVNPEQKTTVTVTVTNSGGSSVNVIGVTPTCTPTGGTAQSVSVALGAPPLGPGRTIAVAGSNGTLALAWDVVAHAPQAGFGSAMPAEFVYDVGAVIYTSDGAVTAATVAALTVSSPSHT